MRKNTGYVRFTNGIHRLPEITQARIPFMTAINRHQRRHIEYMECLAPEDQVALEYEDLLRSSNLPSDSESSSESSQEEQLLYAPPMEDAFVEEEQLLYAPPMESESSNPNSPIAIKLEDSNTLVLDNSVHGSSIQMESPHVDTLDMSPIRVKLEEPEEEEELEISIGHLPPAPRQINNPSRHPCNLPTPKIGCSCWSCFSGRVYRKMTAWNREAFDQLRNPNLFHNSFAHIRTRMVNFYQEARWRWLGKSVYAMDHDQPLRDPAIWRPIEDFISNPL
jgi:hypothetical protein